MYTQKSQEWKNYIIVFLMVLLPKVICCFFGRPVSIASDEIATMSAGAYIAGLDWSEIISRAGYYGGGMTIFTAPIYWLTDNPVVIYRFVGIFCAVLQSIPAVIAYYVVRKYYKVQELLAMLISIACGFFVMAEAHVIFNENGLILISWIIMLLLCKLHEIEESGRTKVLYTVMLMAVMSYAMTMHERSVTYWIVLAVLVIFYRWTYERWLVSVPAMIITGIFGWSGSKMIIRFFQTVLWKTADGASLRNASINMSGGFSALKELTDIRAWLSIILGQIHTIGVFTCGLAIVLICAFVAAIWMFMFSKKHRENIKSDDVLNRSMPIVVFFMAAVMITMAGQSISWLRNSMEVYANGYHSEMYGVKAYGYLRYLGIYCGPLLMCGMVWIVQRKEVILKYVKTAFVLMLLVELYWVTCIVPYIHLCTEWGVFSYYYPFSWHWPTQPAGYMAFIPASVIMFIVYILGVQLLKKEKNFIYFAILLCCFANAYLYHAAVTDRINGNITSSWADDGYRVIKAVEAVTDVPETIYAEDLWGKTDHNNYFVYQFLLNRYHIAPERPSEVLDEAILLSNGLLEDGVYDEMIENGYLYAEIGAFEVVLVKGERLQQAFERVGIELLSE